MVTDEINFPPAPGVAWSSAQRRLWDAARSLEKAILQLDDAQLDVPLPGKPSRTIYIELHGAIQHAVYHAGQVMLLHRTGDA